MAKWRKRNTVEDAPMGPRQPHSTVLTAEQEAMIVAFRQRTLLPLDDCLYALQYISSCWQKEPERFRLNTHQHTMGLNS